MAKTFSVVAGVFLLTFCEIVAPLSAQERIPRIINGDPTEDFDAVGIVGSRALGGFCTGTLISPIHVLTAAHCAEVIEEATSGTFELPGLFDGQLFSTSRIHIHPHYNPRTLNNDIAILELSEAVLEVDSLPIFRDAPRGGDELTIVGYGGGGDAQGDDGTFGVKRVGMVTIDDVGRKLIVWVFDDPAESNTASGDSGGPGLIDMEGQFFIASVTSSGTEADAGLGDIAFNTRVDAFADWIDSVVLQSDDGPPEMPPDKPGNRPGNGDHDMKCPPGRRPGGFRPGVRPGYLVRPGGFRRPPSRPPNRRPGFRGGQNRFGWGGNRSGPTLLGANRGSQKELQGRPHASGFGTPSRSSVAKRGPRENRKISNSSNSSRSPRRRPR